MEVEASPEHDRRQRRRFSAEYKERILREADACTERGALGELLRREGIYSSQLSDWRAQREQQGRSGLEAKRPGPKPSKDAKDRQIAELEKRNAKLEKELRISKALIDVSSAPTGAPRSPSAAAQAKRIEQLVAALEAYRGANLGVDCHTDYALGSWPR